MRYFKENAKERFPSVILLVRIHFSRLDNAGFQERVFSTAANVMMKNQSRMGFDPVINDNGGASMLEMRTLLAHNRDLIRMCII